MSKHEGITSADDTSADQRIAISHQLLSLDLLARDVVFETRSVAELAKVGKRVAGIKEKSGPLETYEHVDYETVNEESGRTRTRTVDNTGQKLTQSGLGTHDRITREATINADFSPSVDVGSYGGTSIKEQTILTPTNAVGLAKIHQDKILTSTSLEAKRRAVKIAQKRTMGDTVVTRTMNAEVEGDIEVRQVTERPDEEPVERVWKTNLERTSKHVQSDEERADMYKAARIAQRMVKGASTQLGYSTNNADASVEAKRRKGIEDAKRLATELRSNGIDTGGTHRDKLKNEEL